MKGFGWLGKTGRVIGKGLAYPIRKAGQQAGQGAVQGARTELAKAVTPGIAPTTVAGRWLTTIRLLAQLVQVWRGRR